MNQRLSTWCAMRCAEPLFQQFLGVTSKDAAADKVRALCGVKSRAEFDRDAEAAQRFHKMRHQFIDFTHSQEASNV